nr:MAG TPA: hypothetical protein [Caudoviricetes sp.]
MRDRQTAETGARPSAGNDRPALMMAGHAPPTRGESW